jgi:cytochrome b
MTPGTEGKASVGVWDLPTRLFHWLLVVLIALLYATGEFGLLDMRWHFWLGYATLALIVFRVLWGLFGSQTSRFADFVRGPIAVGRYVKAQISTNEHFSVGHNPLGGWSVLALLLSVLLQSVTGLFASDGIDADGPFSGFVSGYTVKLMTRLHNWNENVLLLLIALHVAAVLFYLLIKHDNLITPMFTGRKQGVPSDTPRFASPWLALPLLLLSLAAVAVLVWYAGG